MDAPQALNLGRLRIGRLCPSAAQQSLCRAHVRLWQGLQTRAPSAMLTLVGHNLAECVALPVHGAKHVCPVRVCRSGISCRNGLNDLGAWPPWAPDLTSTVWLQPFVLRDQAHRRAASIALRTVQPKQAQTAAWPAGGGMTVALGDAALLCGMLRPLPDLSNAAATAQATAGFYSRRTPLSTTINTLANALYQVQ